MEELYEKWVVPQRYLLELEERLNVINADLRTAVKEKVALIREAQKLRTWISDVEKQGSEVMMEMRELANAQGNSTHPETPVGTEATVLGNTNEGRAPVEGAEEACEETLAIATRTIERTMDDDNCSNTSRGTTAILAAIAGLKNDTETAIAGLRDGNKFLHQKIDSLAVKNAALRAQLAKASLRQSRGFRRELRMWRQRLAGWHPCPGAINHAVRQ